MQLFEPNRTSYDLNWTMFGIPVRVHPLFWLMSVILGFNAFRGPDGSVVLLLAWVACVFVSILIHELGHVFMGRAFGSDGHIILYSFGGLAVGSASLSRRSQRILVSLAGPGAGFLFLLVVVVVLLVVNPGLASYSFAGVAWTFGMKDLARSLIAERPDASLLIRETVGNLFFINLFWGLMNLLPVYPLDGGQVSRDVCQSVWGGRGLRISIIISIVTGGVLAFVCLMAYMEKPILPFLNYPSLYVAIMFGLLAFSSYQMLQQTPPSGSGGGGRSTYRSSSDEEPRAPWEQDPDYWKSGREPW